MRAFTTRELDHMRETQESAMQDIGVIMTYSEAQDALNHPVPTWTDGDIVPCGLDPTGGKERSGRSGIVETWEAMIRLPLGKSIGQRDRIRILERYGEGESSAITYEIAGSIQQGPSGIEVPVNRVVPGVQVTA